MNVAIVKTMNLERRVEVCQDELQKVAMQTIQTDGNPDVYVSVLESRSHQSIQYHVEQITCSLSLSTHAISQRAARSSTAFIAILLGSCTFSEYQKNLKRMLYSFTPDWCPPRHEYWRPPAGLLSFPSKHARATQAAATDGCVPWAHFRVDDTTSHYVNPC